MTVELRHQVVGAPWLARRVLVKAAVGGNAVIALGRGRGAKGVGMVRRNGDIALKGQLQQTEEVLPRRPRLVLYLLPVPGWVVVQEGVRAEQHRRHECRKDAIRDRELSSYRFFLRLLQRDDELGDAQVGVPPLVEEEEDLHPGGAVEAGAFELEVVEESGP